MQSKIIIKEKPTPKNGKTTVNEIIIVIVMVATFFLSFKFPVMIIPFVLMFILTILIDYDVMIERKR